ncbi:MAG TPA: bifunctional nicotinamidase/pyrazinamidase [Phycisphaerae bacterium]|nr:bifunctional nicotinamidase/pyrazinamidase [Phycisphaerae bacterium]
MKALILVDIQNDFLPTGTLPVPNGDQVVAVANRYMPGFEFVVASQDWHPANHGSFAANHAGKKPGEMIELGGLPQVMWPVHCVQGTRGADFAAGLEVSRVSHVTRKGMDAGIDSYSAFFDNGHQRATDLHAYLQGRGVKQVAIMGLATDYCVKFTALDARQLGYEVNLILEGCRGVNLKAGDVDAAVAEMRAAGVVVFDSGVLLAGTVR